jgi:hypothetical protein
MKRQKNTDKRGKKGKGKRREKRPENVVKTSGKNGRKTIK